MLRAESLSVEDEGFTAFGEAFWSCPDLADRFDCLIQRGVLVSNSMGDA